MKSYRSLLNSYSNALCYRESTEWSNVWIDSANCEQKKRYMIIGDSTARMVRSSFAKQTSSPVDMIGTSSALDDDLFITLLDGYFEKCIYKYDAIFIQLGHHSRIGKDGDEYKESDFYKFEQDFSALLLFIKQFTDSIIVESIFESIEHNNSFMSNLKKSSKIMKTLYRMGVFKEKPDKRINSITNRKTKITQKVADKMGGVKFIDVNDYMKRQKYIHIDHIHFENKAKNVIAKYMSSYV